MHVDSASIQTSTRHDPAVEFSEQGFAVFESALPAAALDGFSAAYLDLVRERTGERFDDMHEPRLRDRFEHEPAIESEIYSAVRSLRAMKAVATDPSLTSLLTQATPGVAYDLLGKMILRIDMPRWTHEVAHWHQDHYYVRGNHRIVTAWIPLQEVDETNGCLLVAPGSHARGEIEHDREIGKRRCPSAELIESMTTVSVPMKRGDVLLFDALLLHSGQVNRSAFIRYSFQFRYSPIGFPIDPGMGERIALPTSSAKGNH